jgi:hypothetical protein
MRELKKSTILLAGDDSLWQKLKNILCKYGVCVQCGYTIK